MITVESVTVKDKLGVRSFGTWEEVGEYVNRNTPGPTPRLLIARWADGTTITFNMVNDVNEDAGNITRAIRRVWQEIAAHPAMPAASTVGAKITGAARNMLAHYTLYDQIIGDEA